MPEDSDTKTITNWNELNSTVASCRLCPRLVEWREEVAVTKRRAYRDDVYWGKPVPGFGNLNARLLVVGLAPGAHGSNRTGRMFTGDASGDFLFPALHRAGFASQPGAVNREDGLTLSDMYITAVCRCVPPANKPKAAEIKNCQPFLLSEIRLLENLQGIIALGRIAFDQVVRLYRAQGYSIPTLKFGHSLHYQLGDGLPWLLASYHPSRQNTQTGRLTVEMFDQVWKKSQGFLNGRNP